MNHVTLIMAFSVRCENKKSELVRVQEGASMGGICHVYSMGSTTTIIQLILLQFQL